MFGSYLKRIKYGFSLSIESLKFSVKNLDVSLLYVIGSILASVPAWIGYYIVSNLFELLGFAGYSTLAGGVASVGIYTFVFFFVRGTIVHITGARMLGENVSLIDGIRNVSQNPELFLRWAVIKAVVRMLYRLSRQSNNNIAGRILRYFADMAMSIWKAATYFILPTLTFYSSDDTKAEAAQSIYVLRKRYLEIASVKIATMVLYIVGFFFWIFLAMTIVIGGFSAGFPIAGILLFFVTVFGGMLLFWLISMYMRDVVRTALYLESEAPEKVTGFNTSVFGAEIPDDETVRKDFVPNSVEEFLEKHKGDGKFEDRL